MPRTTRFRWLNKPPHARLEYYRMHMRKELVQILTMAVPQVEAYMKDNAPWEDRTGDARANLSATAEFRVLKHEIHLMHGVDYGFWLEVIQAGRFSIIVPTIEVMGPRIMMMLDGINEGRFPG